MSASGNETSEYVQKLRDLRAQLGFLSQADGSCALEQGSTVIWCGVNGPGDVISTKRDNGRLLINVVYKQGLPVQDTTKIVRMITSALESTVDCSRHPRAMLDVTLQELQRDGSEASAALNATCLACLDNGITMKGIFCGVTVAACEEKLVLDPSEAVSSSASAVFTFAIMAQENDEKLCVVAGDTDGVFPYDTYEAARKLALVACKDVLIFYRQLLQNKLMSC